jgi:hypothetical protein
MNCQDLSRILESCDVRALSMEERSACEAHAASCPDCGPEWIVYTRLAAIASPPMPRQLAARCEAAAVQSRNGVRPSGRTILLGTILVVAVAAAMLVAHLASTPPTTTALPTSASAQKVAGPIESATLQVARPGQDAPVVQPATVLLVLDEYTQDAIGRDFGRQVYEHARQELRALPGVALIDAGSTAATAPAFRITYLNLAKSGTSGEGPYVQVEMVFEVQASDAGADGTASYHPVFRSAPPPPDVVDMPSYVARLQMMPSFDAQPDLLGSSARTSARPANRPSIPADCIERQAGRCPYTSADVAAFTILSWYLETNSPDSGLAQRLHAMLRDASTPSGLWMMALVNLHKHRQLHLDVTERLAAWQRVGLDYPELGDELLAQMLADESRVDVVNQVRGLLLKDSPDRRWSEASAARLRLVALLAKDLKNEPGAQAILQEVAATDPVFEVRAEAKRVLGVQPEPEPEARPTQSFTGSDDAYLRE